MSEEFDRGLELRRAMFGPEGAEKQLEAATDFTRPMQEWVTKQCFGEAWQRPVFDRKTRSLLTLAMLVAMGRSHEVKIHTRGAIANGVSKEEIRELLMHSIIYCGIPMAVDGFRSASEVLKDLGLEA
ncbi:carboxymuconolactone decarboxylase family protein [Polymorphum gilvum]|uniref:Gamma-carboxymuconolactone decarboxylase protein n=1 Tax=Polymorphum gilvum (strain LMG 25793 / CGMCC 1.9160 / SL003B-26A1) TaxID=991905 RepID=F2IXH5_POLGS|nr:carboxymuconolactone decarboxylase family protein [Polymorphum gilvum]ADZ71598.1 Gamma-carboxymuconolactone decarboxylase protein [Polymorphum gilvum SL003B-26A1]